MMDHSLQMISYIADIGNIVVLMARRKPAGRKGSDAEQATNPMAPPKKCWMLCHVFISEDVSGKECCLWHVDLQRELSKKYSESLYQTLY